MASGREETLPGLLEGVRQVPGIKQSEGGAAERPDTSLNDIFRICRLQLQGTDSDQPWSRVHRK